MESTRANRGHVDGNSLRAYNISQLQLLSQSKSTEVLAALDQIQQIISTIIGLEALALILAFAASMYWGFTLIRCSIRSHQTANAKPAFY